MPKLLVSIVASLPLAFLTAASLVGLLAGLVADAASQAGDVAAVTNNATGVLQCVDRDRPFIDGFAIATTFGSPGPVKGKQAGTPALDRATKSWLTLENLHGLLQAMPPPNAQAPAEELTAWQGFKKLQELEALPPASARDVLAAINRRIGQKTTEDKNQRDQWEREEIASKAQSAAQQQFDAHNWAGCIQRLKQLRTEIDLARLDPGKARAIQTLLDRATFRCDLDEAQKQPTPRGRLRELRALRDSGSLSEEERALFEGCKQEIKDLEGQIALNDLRARPPDRVRDLVDQAEKVLRSNSNDITRNELRRILENCLKDHLILPSAEKFKDVMEVEFEDGSRQTGYFVRRGNREPIVYRYYETQADRDRGEGRFSEVARRTMKSEPQESVPWRCWNDYDRTRTQLLQRLTSQEEWKRAAEAWAKLEKDLDAYAAQGGAKWRGNLSFKEQTAFARDVAAEWADLVGLLRP